MKKIKYLIIYIWKQTNNLIYSILKLFKTKNKITFISRQTNGNVLDFDLIIEELKNQKNNFKIVVLNKMIEKGILKKIKYAFYIYYQMYHIATSKVVIIDGYCIPICTLKHKKELKVIQIWHALGALKKFGYSILNKKEGAQKEIALSMDMHKNYTYILTSSKFAKRYFKEAFNAKEEQMKIIPLPRVDFLKSDIYKEEIVKKFYKYYPELENDNKKKILYVPTFRRNVEENYKKIIKSFNYNKFDLIIKAHDITELVYKTEQEIYSQKTELTGLELLHIADYVITDYSAIVYEAAVINKPIYFYNYDYKEYVKKRGFYVDYKKEMPGLISGDITKILNAIEKDEFDYIKLKKFREKYIVDMDNYTKQIVKLIMA